MGVKCTVNGGYSDGEKYTIAAVVSIYNRMGLISYCKGHSHTNLSLNVFSPTEDVSVS